MYTPISFQHERMCKVEKALIVPWSQLKTLQSAAWDLWSPMIQGRAELAPLAKTNQFNLMS